MRFLLPLALMACKPPIDLSNAPTSGSRHRMPHVEFDIWTDYLSLEVGLSDECAFLDPLVDDNSVRHPPVQVFWVMYQNEKDAVEGAVLKDIFWLGDRVVNKDYPKRDGLTAYGFKYPSKVQQGFLKIESIEVAPDRMQVDGVLSDPIDARLRMVASQDAGGVCEIVHTYCKMPCDDPSAELDHIELELGFLNSVKRVKFVER